MEVSEEKRMKDIDRILGYVEEMWKRYPHMRFGQVIENFCMQGAATRFFFQEDTVTRKKLERSRELY